MWGSGRKGWGEPHRGEDVLLQSQPVLGRGCLLAQAECGQKRKDRNSTKVWSASTLFCLIGGERAYQLIIYEAKIGNLEGAYLALSWVNKGAPVCVRVCVCLSYGEGWYFAVRSPFPEHERVQGFQELRAQVKSNTLHTQEGGCVDSM